MCGGGGCGVEGVEGGGGRVLCRSGRRLRAVGMRWRGVHELREGRGRGGEGRGGEGAHTETGQDY